MTSVGQRVSDAAIKKVKDTRHNWWEAFKYGISLKGYKYYKPPPEYLYRFPSPGSHPQWIADRPGLFKADWKKPFRESEYQIQQRWSDPIADSHELYQEPSTWIPGGYDPSNPEHQKLIEDHPNVKWLNGTTEEDIEEFVNDLEAEAENVIHRRLDKGLSTNDLDEVYSPEFAIWYERGFSGWESNPRYKTLFIEMEYWIEDQFAKNRKESGQMPIYKGTPKKWQVLDDGFFDKDQIDKIQKSIDAPISDQLDDWKELSDKPFMMPINNQNAVQWRDYESYTDSADFDASFLKIDMEKKRKYFLEQYEKPKELEE